MDRRVTVVVLMDVFEMHRNVLGILLELNKLKLDAATRYSPSH